MPTCELKRARHITPVLSSWWLVIYASQDRCQSWFRQIHLLQSLLVLLTHAQHGVGASLVGETTPTGSWELETQLPDLPRLRRTLAQVMRCPLLPPLHLYTQLHMDSFSALQQLFRLQITIHKLICRSGWNFKPFFAVHDCSCCCCVFWILPFVRFGERRQCNVLGA